MRKKKIFVICTVRNATPEYKQKLEDYVKKLEDDGNEVHLPHRDTNQDARGIDICTENMEAIIWADEVHIFYNPESQGSHFDMGVAFALNKPIKVVESVPLTEGKSYQRMLKEWEERNIFDAISFPIIRNVQAKTLASQIKGKKPSKKEPKIKERYTDHWGNEVKVYESGFSTGYGPGHKLQYGDYGHDIIYGWFVIDEEGNRIYFGNEGYTEIMEMSLDFWKVINNLQQLFPFPNYRVERGKENNLYVNDKQINGVKIYPGKWMVSVQDETNHLSELIQQEITSKRIQPKKFGIE